ncbi:MAG: c-type cytochrome [Acidobacteriota bacterium]|nr:c-type cytochrome [Acidobacteriota bacterium]
MAKKLVIFVLLSLGMVLPGIAQDLANGKAKYAVCLACHMDKGQGNKALNSPAIAGQEDWYLERQIKYFKEGLRGKHPKDVFGAQMVPMMMTLTTEKDIKDVAAYIAAMEPAPREAPTVKGDVAKGKALYAVCATCHGPDGKGIKAMNAPNLTLQQDWYLERQIKNYKEGIRGSDPKDIYGLQMRPMIMTLPDDQAIKDVVVYIMSLK